MPDMNQVKNLIDSYVECWQRHRPDNKGIYEDIDCGCEYMQVFRNGFHVQDFSHGELCELAGLLTRSLKGQINSDHKIFWSWCSFVAQYFHEKVELFKDTDWLEAFVSMVDLLLSAERPAESIPGHMQVTKERLKYMNNHLISVCYKKHALAGAQAFAVLEGLLRRKASNYIAVNGIVLKYFTVMGPAGESKTIRTGTRIDSISDNLRLFNQVVTRDRGRSCPAFRLMEGEILNLHPSAPNGYDLFEEWHNDLIHGKDHWQTVTPTVVNTICLLVIDEIAPDLYNGALPDIKKRIQWTLPSRKIDGFMSQSNSFPPDLMY